MSLPVNVGVMGHGQPLPYQSQQANNHQSQHQASVSSPYFGSTSGGYRNAGTPLINGASLMQGYGVPMGNPYPGGAQNASQAGAPGPSAGPSNPMVGMPAGVLTGALGSTAKNNDNVTDVWKWNCESQFKAIQRVSERYNYVAVDCKFPGIVARPIGSFKSTSEYHYQTLRSNVDLLSAIQIGLSFTDEFGNAPIGTNTWQFNLHFDVNEDMCSGDGIDLLQQTGIDFARHQSDGIDPFAFGEFIISSGLVLESNINWVTFHSGYDLGYLLAIMLNKEVPVEEKGFLKALGQYFPSVWDVKYIVKVFKLSNSSQLLEVADEFQILRPGMLNNAGLNQAGSDALTAMGCFFEARRMVGDQNLSKIKGHLFGLGEPESEKTTESAPAGLSNGGPVNGAQNQSAANIFQFGKMGGGAGL